MKYIVCILVRSKSYFIHNHRFSLNFIFCASIRAPKHKKYNSSYMLYEKVNISKHFAVLEKNQISVQRFAVFGEKADISSALCGFWRKSDISSALCGFWRKIRYQFSTLPSM